MYLSVTCVSCFMIRHLKTSWQKTPFFIEHLRQLLLKRTSLLKEGIDLFESNVLKTHDIDKEEEEKLLSCPQFLIDGDITFTTGSRHVALHIAGYIARNLSKQFGSCCSIYLVGDLDQGNEDLQEQLPEVFCEKTLAQVFSCEFCKISKNTFFTEHFRVAASRFGLSKITFKRWLDNTF